MMRFWTLSRCYNAMRHLGTLEESVFHTWGGHESLEDWVVCKLVHVDSHLLLFTFYVFLFHNHTTVSLCDQEHTEEVMVLTPDINLFLHVWLTSLFLSDHLLWEKPAALGRGPCG